MIKGLKGIQEKSAEVEMFSNQNRVQYLYLQDGDSALVRFIDDNEMMQTKMHEYEEMAPTGKQYRKAYCIDNLLGEACKWCASGNIAKNVYVFSVYVYAIIHKAQNPKLNSDPDAPKWEAVTQGKQIVYKEAIDEMRILRTKWGKDGYIKNMIIGFVDEYGTLCDRDYKFSRNGGGIKTLYSFLPKDHSDESAEVARAKVDAISIEEILLGNRAKTAAAPEVAAEAPAAKTALDSLDVADEELEDLF